MRTTRAERFARWEYRRYGQHGRDKPVWAWLTECVMFRWRPRRAQRRLFLGEPTSVLKETE